MEVTLKHPEHYAFVSCMVNRYFFQREDGFMIAHFGLVNSKGELIDYFRCVLPEHTLEAQKENLVQYSERVGSPKEKCPAWDLPAPDSRLANVLTVPVVDFVHTTNWDEAYAEICFWNYSRASLADKSVTGKRVEMPTWGVALVRCKIDLQRGFLSDLYEINGTKSDN